MYRLIGMLAPLLLAAAASAQETRSVILGRVVDSQNSAIAEILCDEADHLCLTHAALLLHVSDL